MPIAPPQTRQFRSFETNIEYARKLIRAGESLQGLEPGALDVTDLYRAAWVQAVSATDHWLHEELFRRVEELAADPTAALPAQLQRFELPLSVIESVRREERTMAEAVLHHVKAKWAFASMHNPRKIAEAYRLVSDIDLWQSVAVRLNEWNQHRTNFSSQTVRRRFTVVIERRNKIAHYADLEDGHFKQRRPLTAADVNDAVDWLERVVLAVAKVLDD
ncbi:hypothetical protein ACF1DY_06115 [Streptomyces albus]|uniref:hypothetical protein n=1 Tax=Streptomyces sp. GSL17-113 TaxID=3115365 RepID=UPI002E79C780|nr:hypothetical protein [Streptomyces sp. GSL17-113]